MKGNKLSTLALVIGLGVGVSVAVQSSPRVGVTIYKYDDDFISLMRQEIRQEGQKLNLELLMNDSQNSQTIQNHQVEALISKAKVKALAVNLVDPMAAYTIMGKAQLANIPVVFFNKDPGNVIQKYDKAYYVGTDSKQAGIIQAELIEKQWKANSTWDLNGDGKIQFALLTGEKGHPDAEARTQYVIEQLNAKGIQTEPLFVDSAKWDSNLAKTIMTNWLTQQKAEQIEMVIANNDSMGIGALLALKAQGKKLPIFGVDALPEALNLIKTGELAGTVLNNGAVQAQAVMQLAKQLAQGKEIPHTHWQLKDKAVRIPYVGIDRDNLGDFLK